jgi:peptidoglycan/xylan/chitin deacetylase (PgdA/CDA1 family)
LHILSFATAQSFYNVPYDKLPEDSSLEGKLRKIVFVTMLFTLIVSCSPVPVSIPATAKAQPPSILPLPTTVQANTPVPTATILPTPTFTPNPTPSDREIALIQHNEERIQYLAEQGLATQIPVLEYHGDNYYFEYENGAVVELSPAGFESQMKWFTDNHVHSVTGQELNDWMEGIIELPARSVVLTFDLGNGSVNAVSRMISIFKIYQIFGIFTIYVKSMNEGESVSCVNDVCWQTFRDAYLSGNVDIGSHTMTHRDFATLNEAEGLADLVTSKNIIEEKIGNGCIVNTLTWPFESVPAWGSNISLAGYTIAFGGNTYPILENTIWRNKLEDYYKFPRILPPGSYGISGRPYNKTLQQIMQMYTLANSNSGGWK